MPCFSLCLPFHVTQYQASKQQNKGRWEDTEEIVKLPCKRRDGNIDKHPDEIEDKRKAEQTDGGTAKGDDGKNGDDTGGAT